MSKTVEDLVKIGRAARTAYIMQHQGVAGTLPDAERAATVAIVRALRDEFGRLIDPTDEWNREGILWLFNEIILGSDAGEKVAVAGQSSVTEPDHIVDANKMVPATAPAPAVCVWTQRGVNEPGFYSTPHGIRHHIFFGRMPCPVCGGFIKFAEAK